MSFLRKNWLLVAILFLGLFLRSYRALTLFMYAHDQDLAAWIVSDILGGHLRLIGQETSVGGVFIGGLYYYILIPFYVLFGMSPVGGLVLSIVLSVVSIGSYYWVFKTIFNRQVGLIVAFMYSASFLIVMTDREAVPTMPVMLWAVWFLYGLWQILEGKQKQGYILMGILIGLIWHLNLGLLVLGSLIPVAFLLSRERDWKAMFTGMAVTLTVSLPLILFEVKHGFIQARAILGSLGAEETLVVGHWAKFDRVMQLVVKNVYRLLGTDVLPIKQILVIGFVVVLLIYLVKMSVVEWRLGVIVALWIGVYIGFFTFNSINLSEYYLNGMVPAYLLIVGVGLAELEKRGKWLMWVLVGLFVVINTNKFMSIDINRSGYLERRAIVVEIKRDAKMHNYPCVAVSYITKPGYELGYRYLFRIEGMHVNQPSSEAPVYTIVFPHSMVDQIDKSIGALGLIYPDYEKYTNEGVAESCSGENANLTDPMFGYLD